jgi:hypothetical protein
MEGVSPAPAAPTQQTSLSPDISLFGELFDASLESRIELGLVREGHHHGTQSSKRIWVEVCGDRALSEYGRQDVAKFRSTLLKLPKHYWKSKAEQEKPILQVIAEAEANAKDGPYQRVPFSWIRTSLTRCTSRQLSTLTWPTPMGSTSSTTVSPNG